MGELTVTFPPQIALRPIEPTPPVHPSDRLLLRPATSLGKPTRSTTTGASGVSFLRRTEYISNETSRSSFKSTTSASLITSAPLAKKARSLAQKAEEESDPVRILAAVMRGFDIANPETVGHGYTAKTGEDKSIKRAEENWQNLRHPTKRGVKPVATFPVLPDPEALGELNGYLVCKFSTDPLGGHAPVHTALGKSARDERVDVGLMRIRYLAAEVKLANAALQSQSQSSQTQSQSQRAAAVAEREGEETLDLYIPSEPSLPHVRSIKRKFCDINDADDDEGGVDGGKHPDGSPPDGFKYQFIRAYEHHQVTTSSAGTSTASATGTTTTTTTTTTNASTSASPQEIALILHDPSPPSTNPSDPDTDQGMCRRDTPRGAYWYPILFRSVLKPKRNEKVAEGFFRPIVLGSKGKAERDVEVEGRVDLLSVRVRELVDEERGRVEEGRRRFLGSVL